MVAAVSSTTVNPKTVSQPQRVSHSQNPMRPPLLPSDSDNARRPKSREVTSRYMSSSTSSSSASVSRRCPSPSSSTTILTPMPSAFRRSESVERTQRGTPHPNSLDFRFGHGNSRGEMSAAQKLLFNSTRSLSVSFQGDSFPMQVSKAKPAPTPGIRKGTPEPRKTTTPIRVGIDQAENLKPIDQQRWHGGYRPVNCVSRSLDCMDDRKKVAGGSGNGNVVRALQNSFVEETSSLPEGNSASDTESVSSGSSNLGTFEGGGGKLQRGPRVVVVPARFMNVGAKNSIPCKVNVSKKQSIDSPASSPRQVVNNMEHSSPVRVPSGPPSPSKLFTLSPSRGGSPCRVRNSVVSTFSNSWNSTPSTINFTNDIRKAKIGDTRMVDAHSLKILYNRFLQWRFVNARADATSSTQNLNAERNLYNAWNTISELRESVRAKRYELQLLRHKLKLASILKGQMIHLDELDLLDQDFSSSLSGVIEALKARTLRLPAVDGAKVEVQDIKDAICSAVDVMQAMTPSICLWLSKVGEVNSEVSKLADVNADERALLDQCNDILSTVASMQVKEFSLRTHMLQLERIRA